MLKRLAVLKLQSVVFLLGLFCLQPASAGYIQMAGQRTYAGCYHEGSGNYTFWVDLGKYPSWSEPDLQSLIITINGTEHDVTDDAFYNGNNGGDYYAEVTVPVPTAPQSYVKRFILSAAADVEYVDYGNNLVTDHLDSTDDPNDPDGTTGDGESIEIILSNIQSKGLTWKSRAVDVHDHVLDVDRPNSSNTYHWSRNSNPDEQGPFPAAYIKGSSPQLEFEAQPLSGSVPVRINFLVVMAPEPTNYPHSATILLSGNKATMNLPALKDEVNIYQSALSWSVECQRSDGSWATLYPPASDGRYVITGLKLYALYATPTAPMAVPWMGVLDKACSWAAGQSTRDDVAQHLTTGLYFSSLFSYNGTGTYLTDVDANHNNTIFRLTDSLSLGPWQSADCRDVSSFLCISGRAVGVAFDLSKMRSNPGLTSANNFGTNPICPIGDDASNANAYGATTWNFHQVCKIGSAIYDACAAQRYLPTGMPYYNPPYNWFIPEYWQNQLLYNPGADWNPVGLVSQPDPSSYNIYDTFVPTVY